MVTMIGSVCQYIDAKRTLTDAADYAMLTDALIAEYPTLTLEEFRLVFDNMKLGKYGNYYERLKAPEFMKAFSKHEEERVDVMELINRAPVYRGAADPTKVEPYDPEKSRLEWKLKNNPFYIKGKNAKDQ